MVKLTPQVEIILKEMDENGWPIVDTYVEPLIAAGFGELPCLVIRNLGRDLVRLNGLTAYLARKFDENNHLRYISTYPECIEEIKNGKRFPSVPGAYRR